MVSSLFSSLHHICVVVPDLEAAEQYYESIGIGPWNELPLTTIIDVSSRSVTSRA